MKIKVSFVTLAGIVIILGMLFTGGFSTASASPGAQAVIPSPTPLEDGRIIYIAQAGDSWWIIAAKMGVAETVLYQLNNASPDTPLIAGQQILLGTAAPTPPVVEPGAATPTPNGPTPTPFPGTGTICIVLYVDTNGNAVREEGELLLPTGAVSILDRTGSINLTGQTMGGENRLCFNDVPEGDFNVSVAVPEGFNPTTNNNRELKLFAGDTAILDFGAQPGSAAQPISPQEGGRNPVIAILGIVFILGGVGLGIYYLIRARR